MADKDLQEVVVVTPHAKSPSNLFKKQEKFTSTPVKEFRWNNVCLSATVKVGKDTVEKPLLVNMSGHVVAGEVVAIMGGSGAGKSTLLNTLAGRIGPGKLSGDILVDGHPRNPSTWKIQCAYVEQDDIMFRNLSVYETLRYSALLRLPSIMSDNEKMDRVESVIAALGLQGCRDTWIGDTQTRGISGGERKRVSIGIELVTNPQILFLDEVIMFNSAHIWT
jgi:ABC-type multidrug transport system ATPase subunit